MFGSPPPPSISVSIRQYLYDLSLTEFVIECLWIPSHIGIQGNKIADSFSKSTSSLINPSSALIPWTDFFPLLKSHIDQIWINQWSSLPSNYASWYRNISPSIPHNPRFLNLNLSKKIISSFSHLRLGHTLLPSHSYKLSLKDSPLCTLHATESNYDISHILFQWSCLIP